MGEAEGLRSFTETQGYDSIQHRLGDSTYFKKGTNKDDNAYP